MRKHLFLLAMAAAMLFSASTAYAEAKFRLIISNNTDSIVRITKVEYVISGSTWEQLLPLSAEINPGENSEKKSNPVYDPYEDETSYTFEDRYEVYNLWVWPKAKHGWRVEYVCVGYPADDPTTTTIFKKLYTTTSGWYEGADGEKDPGGTGPLANRMDHYLGINGCSGYVGGDNKIKPDVTWEPDFAGITDAEKEYYIGTTGYIKTSLKPMEKEVPIAPQCWEGLGFGGTHFEYSTYNNTSKETVGMDFFFLPDRLYIEYSGDLEGPKYLTTSVSIQPQGTFKMCWQDDGNLAIYNNNVITWQTNTKGAGREFVIRTDCNLVIREPSTYIDGKKVTGKVLWDTGTNYCDWTNSYNIDREQSHASIGTMNTAPVADADSYSIDEDGTLTKAAANGVLIGDTDADSDTLTAVKNTGPTNGSLTLSSDGSFTYKPTANYCGSDSFTYHANDGTEDSNVATVTINVRCMDDPPVAVNDPATVTEDDPATLVDVLANDTDIDGGPKSVASISQPANGSVINFGTHVTYKPNLNYCNDGTPTDDFGYTLNGGSTGTVSVTVNCVDDPPVAVDDTLIVTEDDPLTTKNVLFNDNDVDNGPISIASFTQPLNGLVQANGSDLDYKPNTNYCNNGKAGVSTDDFKYTLAPGSSEGTVRVTVYCINDAPVATDNDYTENEDTQLTGNVISDGTPDSDIDGDSLRAVLDVNSTVGTLVLNSDGSFIYDPTLNYCNDATPKDFFTYHVNDGPTPIDGTELDSNIAKVTITVTCQNDPPKVTEVDIASQTADYSDYIGTVKITSVDVDDTAQTLTESGEPALSMDSLSLSSPPGCTTDITPSPTEDGSTCTWTYSGQILHPGHDPGAVQRSDDITFTANDGHIDGTVTGIHTLNVHPEDATVQLFGDNSVAQEVDVADGDATNVMLSFTAWETNDKGSPQLDAADNPHAGTAADGEFIEAIGWMTLDPVGPGPKVGPVMCSPTYMGSGYGEETDFDCAFGVVPVNTYEVIAEVKGLTDTTAYYYGIDEDAFVVYDPSLGFTTAGGWFYWPGSEISEGHCSGYPGDKTNLGYTMKYNKKATKVQGSALLQRHTIDPATCLDAGSYRVKSNALYGLSIGDGTVPDDYGWAAFAGKATYRAPSGENEGNHLFFIYAEDHDEQGCNQGPSDRIWIEVWDKDDLTVMQLNGPDGDKDAEDIMCGNVYVPHKPKGKP